jgi:myo-inositol-1(or 4)-monophosphatase
MLNGSPIEASAGDRLAGARFSGAKRRLDSLAAIAPGIETMPRVPSLALRLARVATGALDGTFAAPNSHDWDLAAADLLVHEAGGLISTLTGQSLIYNRPDPVHGALVAAGRARHAVLLGLIRDRLAEFA